MFKNAVFGVDPGASVRRMPGESSENRADGGSQTARVMSDLLLVNAIPDFAAEPAQSLHDQGRADLAAQVETLRLVDRCRCGDDFCSTFYIAAKPVGAFGPGHSSLEVEFQEGMISWMTRFAASRCFTDQTFREP